jgi:glycosyltransferase involved in cell wall biosynthesis
MKVSVVIPTYNYGAFLAEAIRSVQQQTLQDLEIIVVDDGSTDQTPEVLRAIEDSRLRVHRIPNSGVAVARNVGFHSAKGEYIAQLDSDDRWRPTMLEKCVAVLDGEAGVSAVFTNFVRFDADGIRPHPQFTFMPELAHLPTRPSAVGEGRVLLGDAFPTVLTLSQYPAYMQATVLRASRVRDLRFRPGMVQGEDLHYMLRVYQRGQAAFIAEPLVEVRRHDNNSYNSLLVKQEADVEALHLLASEPMSAAHAAALRRETGRALVGLSYHYYHRRRPLAAARAAARALPFSGSRMQALKRLALLPALPLLADPAKADWDRGLLTQASPAGRRRRGSASRR